MITRLCQIFSGFLDALRCPDCLRLSPIAQEGLFSLSVNTTFDVPFPNPALKCFQIILTMKPCHVFLLPLRTIRIRHNVSVRPKSIYSGLVGTVGVVRLLWIQGLACIRLCSLTRLRLCSDFIHNRSVKSIRDWDRLRIIKLRLKANFDLYISLV